MIIEIKLPAVFRKAVWAWRCAKDGWKTYERRDWNRTLDSMERQKKFEEMYKKHMAEAPEKMRAYRDTGKLPTMGKPKMSDVAVSGRWGVGAEI